MRSEIQSTSYRLPNHSTTEVVGKFWPPGRDFRTTLHSVLQGSTLPRLVKARRLCTWTPVLAWPRHLDSLLLTYLPT